MRPSRRGHWFCASWSVGRSRTNSEVEVRPEGVQKERQHPFPLKSISSQRLLGASPVILDNLSAHKTKRVDEFLDAHPNVTVHFTPTYSSWLNQVELWFAKIERDLIYRGVFTSVKDLARSVMTYIRRYNQEPKPIKWQYDDPSRRISVA